MDTVLKVTLWGSDVAALIWDSQRETAVLEFFGSFSRAGLDIAPLNMPLADLQRGERFFSFPALSLKTFQGLPGLIADSLPDDYGNSVIDEWFSRRGLSVQITPVDNTHLLTIEEKNRLLLKLASPIPRKSKSPISWNY
jgi:serine/threonine-protein kinase HipA